ncbi:MAG: GNAT family N-acetyltransferase [Ornithinimicrobium sp.]
MDESPRSGDAPARPGSPYRSTALTPEDAERMATLEHTVWFEVLPGVSATDTVREFDYDRGRAVEMDDQALVGASSTPQGPLVGIYGAFDMHLSVPAAGDGVTRVPMNGLTWVGVHPDHRRRGILSSMMTEHLHGIHDRGESAIAGLWAAEVGIYGRFGYGAASLEVMLQLSTGTDLSAPEHIATAADDITTHMLPAHTEEATAAIHALQVTAAEHTLGTATRPERIARWWFQDFPKARGSKEQRQVLFATRAGTPVGYALLRRTSEWDDHNNPGGELRVAEMGTVDAPALLALSRRLLSFDLISKVKFFARSTDDPLVWWSGGPRSSTMKVTDALWVRLVDVPRALVERGYAAACDVVVEVKDGVCPWNAGRWRLRVDADGIGHCEPSQDPADLTLGVDVLGSAYLGGRSISSLAAAGWIIEHRPGAVRALSRSMRADTEPYGTSGF